MSIPNMQTSPGQWIEWVSQNPGHSQFEAVDFAVRYAVWRQGGEVGPEPEFIERPTIQLRRLVWRLVTAEIEAAKGTFEGFIREGLIAHKVRQNGSPGRRIVRFNPTAEEVMRAEG